MYGRILMIVFCLLGLVYHPAAGQSSSRPTLSVMNLKAAGSVSSEQAVLLTDRFLLELARTERFDVVERSRRDDILKETAFQQSGICDEAACLVQAGKLLGVQKMVGGTIGRIGETFSVNLRMVDVATGRIEQTAIRDFTGPEDVLLTTAMREIAWQFKPGGLTKEDEEELARRILSEKRKREEEARLGLGRELKRKEEAEAQRLAEEKKKVERIRKVEHSRKVKRLTALTTFLLGGSAIGVGLYKESQANDLFGKYKAATDSASADYYEKQVRRADLLANISFGTGAVFFIVSYNIFRSSFHKTSEEAEGPHSLGLQLGLNAKGKPTATLSLNW